MKKLLPIVLVLLSFASSAQIIAHTEDGTKVLLNEDGTWVYAAKAGEDGSGDSGSELFLLKSDKANVGLRLNLENWSYERSDPGADAEYEFSWEDEGVYGLMIAEDVEMSLEDLKEIAIENAKSVSTSFRLVDEDYTYINGKKVLILQMDATIKGYDISYLAYYYSGSSGTVQLLAYTTQNDFYGNKGYMEEFLDGLVIF